VKRHLLVTNDFPPKVGGIQSYLWELWRRLDPGSYVVLTASSDDGAAAFDAEQAERGVHIERVPEPILFFPTPGALAAVRGPKLGKTLPRPLPIDAAKSMADPTLAAGDGRGVERVDVSLDDGHTWRQADLHPAPGRWAWRPWSLTVDVEPGPLRITARAWDDTGATQPESAAALWNPRGYANNAWARVELTVD